MALFTYVKMWEGGDASPPSALLDTGHYNLLYTLTGTLSQRRDAGANVFVP